MPSHNDKAPRCLICFQVGGSHPGNWHLPTCVMFKDPQKPQAEVFWDDLEKSLKASLTGRTQDD